MGTLQLGQVGCGGMGLRHVYGLIELRERGFDTFDLAAVCDLHQSAAGHVASVAEGGLGYSCIAEVRTVETLLRGKPETPFLAHGDTVRIEMLDDRRHSIFGAIEQSVEPLSRDA